MFFAQMIGLSDEEGERSREVNQMDHPRSSSELFRKVYANARVKSVINWRDAPIPVDCTALAYKCLWHIQSALWHSRAQIAN